MRGFDVMVLTPPQITNPGVAIAACRAGAGGVLDLEHINREEAARTALERLRRFTSSDFGVKIGREAEALLPLLAGERLTCVILAGGEQAATASWIKVLQERGLQVLMETISLAEAKRGLSLGVDGLILKGHESGGRVGTDSAFLLIQKWCREGQDLPFWVQGGIGLHTAAACMTAGAAGVVLDAQVLLTREAGLSEQARRVLETFDGSETLCLGERLGEGCRVYARPGLAVVGQLQTEEQQLAEQAERLPQWRQAVQRAIAAGAWPLGQDAAFAKPLAERFGTVAGIVTAVRQSIAQHRDVARRTQPLGEASPLAKSHGTRFPIVQGPMTRVSDTSAFAKSVANAGALPFLALALLRKAETVKLLEETKASLGEQSWGVGILGFAPPDVRKEQLDAVLAVRPPFALIAGGRPDQARVLEKEGIPTYLHVPSPGLLRMFLKDGARRFVFEGRECGGHVGPRTSFVLWETMCQVLMEQPRGEDLHILFAGGIHDDLSAAMVASLAAGLAERGAAVGVLLGTAYLFTQEAVAGGAIVSRFQQEALRCGDTVLLETGPGHAIRCIPTPYAETFEAEKRRLQAEGRGAEEVRDTLEAMNIGRLRVASKGVDRRLRRSDETAKPQAAFESLPEETQLERGMYMIGQVAALRDRVVTMQELHETVSLGATQRLNQQAQPTVPASPSMTPSDIAIVGLSCFLPKADSARAFWHNVLNRLDAVTEVPATHWDWKLYYDANPKAADKITSKWGGFLDDVPFDPFQFGIPPTSLKSIEPVQLLLLEAVRQALADAGYTDRPYDRERTAVILGAGGGAAQLANSYSFRSYLPLLDTIPGLKDTAADLIKKLGDRLPEWTEDTFPGLLLNVAAGRVANRFNLGGPNFSVDAACGSSLAALYVGVRELEAGTSDMALVMGADTVQNPFTYMLFSKTQAFSPRGRCSTFDEKADGIVISEGIGVVVLKRLADAERDGDRIYAVIKGVGASSDGRDKGLTAPRPEGQVRALQRAYEKAGIDPASVGLVEAHGTGTVVGDQTEAESLSRLFTTAGAERQSAALGSVKSMIGHTKCAAGLAGLINATLALHHKVLPPTLFEKPNSKAKFDESPFYLNRQPRPWVHGGDDPRTAGVSAFGFGGTNYHAVLTEYTRGFLGEDAGLRDWPAELFVWRRSTREALASTLNELSTNLGKVTSPKVFAGLAAALAKADQRQPAAAREWPVVAVVATSFDDLKEKLKSAVEAVRGSQPRLNDPRGVYFAEKPVEQSGPVAFLFPGQGSQYPDMLAQVAMTFPEIRETLDQAEHVLADKLDKPLGKLIYPPSPFTPEQEQHVHKALTRTEVAQPAVGAASLAMFRLLDRLGVAPDFLAGHSYGDYAALCAAGAMTFDDLIRISHRRGEVMAAASKDAAGTMAAVEASVEAVEPLLQDLDVYAVNLNSPQQTVISGAVEAVEQALARLKQNGLRGQRIPVAAAFHSPLVAGARQPLAEALAQCKLQAPGKPVYSNTTAQPYPAEPTAIAGLLADHVTSPVRFQAEIEALYQQGARVFVEVGPQAVLTRLVSQTLGDKPHLAVASDVKDRPGLVQLQHLLAQLVVHGVSVRVDSLFTRRDLPVVDPTRPQNPELSPRTWLVNSSRVRPLNGPEPATLLHNPQPKVDLPPRRETMSSPTNGSIKPNGAVLEPQPPPADLPVNGHVADEVPADDVARVMLRYQDMMTDFVEAQKNVMLTYLQKGGRGGQPAMPAVPRPAARKVVPPPVVRRSAPIEPPPARKVLEEKPLPAPTPKAETNGHAHAAPARPGPEMIQARLLEIVSKRTGYPPEMLGLDMHLEADLGIDSIKRVEILGSLAETLGGAAPNVEMEKLTGIKTLRGLLEKLAPAAAVNGHVEKVKEGSVNPFDRGGILRRVVRAVNAPVSNAEQARRLNSEGVLLITDDGRGVAVALADRLHDQGQRTVLIQNEDADVTDPQSVENLLRSLRQRHGALTGLIHLLPLAQPSGEEPWTERMRREVKSLFLLARGLAADLPKAEQPVCLAATAMGGTFGVGSESLPETFFPGQGGVAGLMKCLAHEWRDVHVRVVDLDALEKPEALADHLLTELIDRDGPVEIGHVGGRRVTLECVAEKLVETDDESVPLNAQSTVLVTGGARGITAAVALRLAQRYQPNLILVGRSPLPADAEPAETAGLTSAVELKPVLMRRLQKEGRPATPAAIEATYQRLLQDREILANIAALKEAGARVHYHPVDVRDEQAFGSLLAQVEKQFGGIDGVLHGAGVIHDKLVTDKTPESFDRVFGTKVDSALILARHLKPERVKFCVFFASVAGRFGNAGQSDYAAANEVLTKLAAYLDSRWSGRVVSVAWGPWSGLGMVAEVEEHLRRRGLQMIPPEVGPLFLDEELCLGRKGETEVVIAGDVGTLALTH